MAIDSLNYHPLKPIEAGKYVTLGVGYRISLNITPNEALKLKNKTIETDKLPEVIKGLKLIAHYQDNERYNKFSTLFSQSENNKIFTKYISIKNMKALN